MDGNPLVCDCKSLPMAKMIQSKLDPVIMTRFILDIDNPECQAPVNLRGRSIREIPLERFACKFPTQEFLPNATCPDKCSCYFVPETEQTNVVCTQQVISYIKYLAFGAQFANECK